MRLLVPHLVVVGLPVVWEDDVALLRARGILNGVAASDAFSVLNHVMLGGRVLHRDQALSGRDLRLIEKLRRGLIVILVLKSLEELLRRVFGPLYFLHFLPNVFNVEVHDIILGLKVEAAGVAHLLPVSRHHLRRRPLWDFVRLSRWVLRKSHRGGLFYAVVLRGYRIDLA
jgi:hypothetical protein